MLKMAKFCMDMWKHKLCPFDYYILQIEAAAIGG